MVPAEQMHEMQMLSQFLDHFRSQLESKVVGITEEQAHIAAVEPSDLSLLGLIRHAAEVERHWFRQCLLNEEINPIWYGTSSVTNDPDGDFHASPTDTLADALEIWRNEVRIARQNINGLTADSMARAARSRTGVVPSLRWIMIHMIEEYARHCGHADLIRERLDAGLGLKGGSNQ